MSDWKALVGRVTLFPATPLSSSFSALTLFKDIWAGEPDNFQKPTNPLMPTIAQARRNGMSASCSVHAGRIDLSLDPSPNPGQIAQHPVAMIDDTVVFYRSLTQIINAIKGNIIPGLMARVALYLQFLKIGESFNEANKILTGVIPRTFGLTLSDEQDVIFQINKPRASTKVDSIKLNTLTKWSVERIQVFTVNVPAPGMPVQTVQVPQDIRNFIAPMVVFDNISQL
jgi:hypothetical protein